MSVSSKRMNSRYKKLSTTVTPASINSQIVVTTQTLPTTIRDLFITLLHVTLEHSSDKKAVPNQSMTTITVHIKGHNDLNLRFLLGQKLMPFYRKALAEQRVVSFIYSVNL